MNTKLVSNCTNVYMLYIHKARHTKNHNNSNNNNNNNNNDHNNNMLFLYVYKTHFFIS